MKKQLLTTLVCAGVIGLSGCARDTIRGVYEGYPVEVNLPTSFRVLNLNVYSTRKDGGKIEFKDYTGDNIFDRISLSISKGDSVGKYASLEIGQRILDELKKQGEQK
jgi:hypothetical protein